MFYRKASRFNSSADTGYGISNLASTDGCRLHKPCQHHLRIAQTIHHCPNYPLLYEIEGEGEGEREGERGLTDIPKCPTNSTLPSLCRTHTAAARPGKYVGSIDTI